MSTRNQVDRFGRVAVFATVQLGTNEPVRGDDLVLTPDPRTVRLLDAGREVKVVGKQGRSCACCARRATPARAAARSTARKFTIKAGTTKKVAVKAKRGTAAVRAREDPRGRRHRRQAAHDHPEGKGGPSMKFFRIAVLAAVLVGLFAGTAQAQTRIDDGPFRLTNDAEPVFSVSGDRAAGVPHGPARLACRAPPGIYRSAKLADGSHVFRVRSTADGTSAFHSFTVDTVAPELTVDAGPDEDHRRHRDADLLLARGGRRVPVRGQLRRRRAVHLAVHHAGDDATARTR